jgi:hypothetical protein
MAQPFHHGDDADGIVAFREYDDDNSAIEHPEPDPPILTISYRSSGATSMGAPNTFHASPKSKPCFWIFFRRFRSSHSNRISATHAFDPALRIQKTGASMKHIPKIAHNPVQKTAKPGKTPNPR